MNPTIQFPLEVPGTDIWRVRAAAPDTGCGCPSTFLEHRDGAPLAVGTYRWTAHAADCDTDTDAAAALDVGDLFEQLSLTSRASVTRGVGYAQGITAGHITGLTSRGRAVLDDARLTLRKAVDVQAAQAETIHRQGR